MFSVRLIVGIFDISNIFNTNKPLLVMGVKLPNSLSKQNITNILIVDFVGYYFFVFVINLNTTYPYMFFNKDKAMFQVQYLLAQFPLSIPDVEGDPHKYNSFCTSNRRDVADLSTSFRHFHRSFLSTSFNFVCYLVVLYCMPLIV